MILVTKVHRPTELFQIQSLVLSFLFFFFFFSAFQCYCCNTVVKIAVVKGKGLKGKRECEEGMGWDR